MKTRIFSFSYTRMSVFFFLALIGFTLTSCCCINNKSAASVNRPPNSPSVADIVASVQTALDSFYQYSSNQSTLPQLKSVKVALQTVADTKISLEADYLLIALKGYNENSETQELDVILTPQKRDLVALSLVTPPTITETLKAAIQSAQKQIQRAYTSKGSGRILNTTEVDVQISFVVVWDGSAGVNKWVLSPISLSGSIETSRKTTHTITITFADPPK